MKKGIKLTTASFLALSALTPVAVFAAENEITVESGIYTANGYTSLDQFEKLSNAQKAELLGSESAVVVVGKDALKATLILSATEDQINESIKSVEEYAAENGVEFTENGVKPVETELTVKSVSAINAQKIKVVFNQEVAGGTGASQAELAANYVITGLQASTTVTPELEDDNKTVILSLDKPILNETTVAVTVNPIESKADATKKTERYTSSFYFDDTVKPTYAGFDNKKPGVVTLKFSEDLDQSTIIPANIVVTKADGTAVVVKTSGAGANELTLTAKANGFELSGLDNNVEYNVAIKDVTDLAGNLTSPNVVTTTVKSTVAADTVAPQVTNIVAKGLNKVVVSVSEDLQDISTTPGTTPAKYVNLAGTGLTLKATAAQVYDKEAGTVTVELDATLPSEGDVITITASGHKDLAGNAGANFVKSVGFSAISKVTNSEVVAKTTGGVTEDYVKVTFDKEIALTTPGGAVSATLLTNDNVEKTISIPAANFAKGTGNELNVLYIKVEGLTGLEEGKLEIPVAKTVVTTLDKDAKVTVDYKAIASDLTAPAINTGIGTNGITVSGNKFTVNYTQDMGQSALDLNNYTVDGVKVFESAIFKGDKKTVELTLKPNALPLTADYDVVISKAVQNEKGIALKADYVTTETITETVQPEVKKAVVAADGASVTLTFSEAVNVSANAFELFVDGTKVGTTVAAINSGSEATTATITVTTPLTAAQIAKTLTVKAATGAVVKDAAGNALKDFELVEVSLAQ